VGRVPVLLALLPEVPMVRAGVTALPPAGWLTEKVSWMLYSLTSGGDSCDALKEQVRPPSPSGFDAGTPSSSGRLC
jgi:hypothetical protein